MDRRIVNVSLSNRVLAYRIHGKFHLDMVKAIMNDFNPEEEEILLVALDKLNKHLKDIYKTLVMKFRSTDRGHHDESCDYKGYRFLFTGECYE